MITGDIDRLSDILEAGYDMNRVSDEGTTPLIACCTLVISFACSACQRRTLMPPLRHREKRVRYVQPLPWTHRLCEVGLGGGFGSQRG